MKELYFGDCLDVMATLESRSFDLLLTDPPYGNNSEYWGGKRIAGDEHPLAACGAVAAAYRLLKMNRSAFVFTSATHLPFMTTFIARYTDFRLKDVLVWDKLRLGLGTGFRRSYELILALEKGKPVYRSRGLPNVLGAANLTHKAHPHEKPVALLRTLIQHATDPGAAVLDPFLGSGATAVAAKELGRRYAGIEIDPKYFELAERRLRIC